MFKKFSFILSVLAVLALTAQARIVLDTKDNKIEIPDKITYAMALVTPMVQIAAMLGNDDKIISGSTKLPPIMTKIFPKIRTNNNPSGMMVSSVEAIIAAKPQVVFGPTDYLLGEQGTKQLRAAGIPVVNTVAFRNIASIEEIKQSVTLIGAIFGGESVKKAREFNAYFDENVAFVQSRTAKVAKKKRVLVLDYKQGHYTTNEAGYMSAAFVAISGGENLSSKASKEDMLSKYINEEQVIVYNPDVIITHTSEGREKILRNTALSRLKAVREKQVFVVPSGIHIWSARSAETALCPLWLGQVLYPELFADLNLAQKTREFYKRFYRYDLSENELQEILHPAKYYPAH